MQAGVRPGARGRGRGHGPEALFLFYKIYFVISGERFGGCGGADLINSVWEETLAKLSFSEMMNEDTHCPFENSFLSSSMQFVLKN